MLSLEIYHAHDRSDSSASRGQIQAERLREYGRLPHLQYSQDVTVLLPLPRTFHCLGCFWLESSRACMACPAPDNKE